MIMDTAKFKEGLKSLIQEYNGHSWQWIPNNFHNDLVELTKGNSFCPYNDTLTKTEEELLQQQKELDIFLEVEKQISNAYFFWSWIPEIYKKQTFSQNYVDKFSEAFARNNRLKLPLMKRQASKKLYREYNAKIRNVRGLDNPTQNKLNKLIRKTKRNLIIYRGFSIHKDADIRVGRYKTNNPQAEQQDAGIGLSFTFNRAVANFFATQYYIENGKLYWMSSSGIKEETPSIPSLVNKDIIDIDKSRRAVATYSIHKDDVIYVDASMREYEVLTFPNRAKLLRYDFLNPKEVFRLPKD